MSTAVVLFTRDLRVRDNPTLQVAARDHDGVVALFVLDGAILSSDYNRPNRAAFLADCLADLHESLQSLGVGLVVRHGDPVTESLAVAREAEAEAVYVSGDVSALARRRAGRLREATKDDGIELRVCEGTHFVVPAGVITPQHRDHMAVFTPYFRRWTDQPSRPVGRGQRRLTGPSVASEALPSARDICAGDTSPDLDGGGETEARKRLSAWLRRDVDDYADRNDDLAGDATSRLSPYLHFGCLSPREIVARARDRGGPGAEAFVRQVAWRDFYAQVLAARPDAVRADYRTQEDRWRRDADELTAWKEGRTGYPVVDAGMRQLRREGWMHNRARLLVGNFLTKVLYQDWRDGADHFFDLLVDGDIASNTMNWQWVAGTGTDTRPNRTYNTTKQAHRHDPNGDYVRRYVPELAEVAGPAVHEPWKLPAAVRSDLSYPEPIVDEKEAVRAFREARGR